MEVRLANKAGLKDDRAKHLVTSLLVCLPGVIVSGWLIEARVLWSAPMLVTMGVLCAGVANFSIAFGLERMRSRLGVATMPSLLGVAGIVLLLAICGAVDRFVYHFGFEWMIPLVGLCLAYNLYAVFREKILLLKLHLVCNSLALAVLWGLCDTGKVALPF